MDDAVFARTFFDNASLVRRIATVLDLSWVHSALAPHYSGIGRPSIDPTQARPAVKDYLATLDDAAFGAASDVTPKFVAASDPATHRAGSASATRRIGMKKSKATFAYATWRPSSRTEKSAD